MRLEMMLAFERYHQKTISSICVSISKISFDNPMEYPDANGFDPEIPCSFLLAIGITLEKRHFFFAIDGIDVFHRYNPSDMRFTEELS